MAFSKYVPGYWHKKQGNDNKIWYSWLTENCSGCDPTRTDDPDWDYWSSLGPDCLDPPTSPNIVPTRIYEVSVDGTELSPIAPFTIRAVVKVHGNLLIGWVPNADPAGPKLLDEGQSDHFLFGKLVPAIGGFIGKFVGENTTAQPNNHGTFILRTYNEAFHHLLYEPGVATPSVTANPTTKIILMRFADDTLKTLLVTGAANLTKYCVAGQYKKSDGSCGQVHLFSKQNYSNIN
jgi:hypothetical protein